MVNAQNSEIQERRKKQFLAFSLLIVFITSTIPDFLPIIFPETNLAWKLIFLWIWYILFPVGLVLLDSKLYISSWSNSSKWILWSWISNLIILGIFLLIIILFWYHASFEINKDLCLNSNKESQQLDLYKQCIFQAEHERFKPFH